MNRSQGQLTHKRTIVMTVAGLFTLALLVRLAVVVIGQFDGLYGQDAYAYLQQSVAIAERLPQGEPPPADFFWPNGYPLMAAALIGVLGSPVLAGQGVSLLCGALLAPLVYLLARDLFPHNGQGAGALAGVIVALAGQPVLSSVVVMADMAALFWATLAAWLAVRAALQPRWPGWLLLAAGLAAGLAVISRWAYVLMIPALAGYGLYQIWRGRLRWPPVGLSLVGGLAVVIPQVVWSLNRPAGLLHSWLLGWRPLNFLLRHVENVDGVYDYLLPMGLFYAQPAGHPAYIFPLLGLAGLWAMWQLWQTRNWPAAILLLGWAGAVYLFLGGIPYQNFRFGLTLYPPLVILAGAGVADVGRRAAQKGPVYERLASAGVIISLLGMIVWAIPMLVTFLTAQNRSKAIAREVEALLPPQATLLAFGITLTAQHYSSLNTLEFFYCTEDDLQRLTQSETPAHFQPVPLIPSHPYPQRPPQPETPAYLLINVPNFDQQWPGRAPYVNYHWLRERILLSQVATFPPYTLFKIKLPSGRPPVDPTSLCLPPGEAGPAN